MHGGWSLWLAVAAGCGPAHAAAFVDRVEEGEAVLLEGEAQVLRPAPARAAEGDVLVDGRPSRAARARAEARIRALRERLGARPLEGDLSLERR